VSYLSSDDIQNWLQEDKYSVTSDALVLVDRAKDVIFTAIHERYDTTSWISRATTPSQVLNLLSKLTASYYLRKIISEDDGEHTYANWLEQSVMKSVEKISSGEFEILETNPAIIVAPSDSSPHNILITAHLPTDDDTRYFTVDTEF